MEKNRQQKEKSLKPLLRGIGRFLGILACIFVIKKVLTMDIPYEVFSTKENIICFLFLIIYQTCVTFWVCVPWRCYIQSLSNVKISYRDIGDIYFKSNMMKYIPGNVFQYVGRNELALRKNVSHTNVLLASILEVGTQFVVSMLLALCLLGKVALSYLKQSKELWIVLFLAIIGVILIVIGLSFSKYKSRFWPKQKFTRSDIVDVTVAILSCLGIQVLGEIQFIIILIKILGNVITLEQIRILMGAYTLAWVIGFITPGVPGGIGVKEGVMIILTENMLGNGMIALAMIVSRIIGIAGDILAYLVSRFMIKRRKTSSKMENAFNE